MWLNSFFVFFLPLLRFDARRFEDDGLEDAVTNEMEDIRIVESWNRGSIVAYEGFRRNVLFQE